MEYIENLLESIVQGFQNIGNIDNLFSLMFDRLMVNQYIGITIVVMVIILLISNIGQSSKLKLLIEKVEKLEVKENERINEGNKRNDSECT